MRDNDGRKLDHRTLEVLRMRAVEQVAAGARPEEVAVAMGFHKNTVYGWLAKVREGGKGALKARAVPGRPPRLNATQISTLYGLVAGVDPRQLSFGFALWTREMVREVIRREFGVALSAVSVGRLLRTMGMSPQRPLHRAYQQNPDAVEAWKTERFPAIRTEARKLGATVYFADEAGIRSDYHAGTTWAPVGKTPVVANTGARYSVNMLSAVSAQGALRFMLHDGAVNAAVFIEFCTRLLHDAAGPVFLVVDGHPSHRAKAVAKFVARTGGRLRLFFLPGYSPQLNPDEWVWKNVKHDRIGTTGVTSKHDLKRKAAGALRRLQKLPALICGFFHDPNLAYITA
ncbi:MULTISPECIES: IS630 family transposase [Amycolatopsis]|uniref:IS630 family transposase n=1 Tax=Amycolatopsis albidoflavus TaxID=102226 RepID=A0ABW5HTW7_9PSEU